MLLRSTLFRPPTVATLLKRDELSAATGRLAQSTSQLAAIRLPHHLVQMPKGLPTRRARTRVQVAIEAVRQSDEYSDFHTLPYVVQRPRANVAILEQELNELEGSWRRDVTAAILAVRTLIPALFVPVVTCSVSPATHADVRTARQRSLSVESRIDASFASSGSRWIRYEASEPLGQILHHSYPEGEVRSLLMSGPISVRVGGRLSNLECPLRSGCGGLGSTISLRMNPAIFGGATAKRSSNTEGSLVPQKRIKSSSIDDAPIPSTSASPIAPPLLTQYDEPDDGDEEDPPELGDPAQEIPLLPLPPLHESPSLQSTSTSLPKAFGAILKELALNAPRLSTQVDDYVRRGNGLDDLLEADEEWLLKTAESFRSRLRMLCNDNEKPCKGKGIYATVEALRRVLVVMTYPVLDSSRTEDRPTSDGTNPTFGILKGAGISTLMSELLVTFVDVHPCPHPSSPLHPLKPSIYYKFATFPGDSQPFIDDLHQLTTGLVIDVLRRFSTSVAPLYGCHQKVWFKEALQLAKVVPVEISANVPVSPDPRGHPLPPVFPLEVWAIPSRGNNPWSLMLFFPHPSSICYRPYPYFSLPPDFSELVQKGCPSFST